MHKYRLVLYSKERLCLLALDRELPVEAKEGMRIMVSSPNRKGVVLIVEKIHWFDVEPDLVYLTCGSVHPVEGARDGEWRQVPFGGITFAGLKELEGTDWKEMQGGRTANYLTGSV